MKIGIITFHCAHNYGAVLQCYALQEFLKSLHHEVYVIDYRPDYFNRINLPFSIKRNVRKNLLKFTYGVCKELFLLNISQKRSSRFEKFISHRLHLISESSLYTDTTFDAYVYGSDQIWNTTMMNGKFDSVYTASFPMARNAKNIGYAVSMGHASLSYELCGRLKELVRNFSGLSVRELSLQAFLSQVTGSTYPVVLDPTLLVGRNLFNDIATNPIAKKPYVLIYQCVCVKETEYIAKQIANELHAEVVSLFAGVSKQDKMSYASPEEFVGYFKYASCVVTTSFHGTVFSILFNRPFYTVKIGNQIDARSTDLLSDLGLQERMVERIDRPHFKELDYEKVNENLERLRQYSRGFLADNLR